jgi:hypothetical protein
MSSESEYSKQVCKLCADICDACAEECEKHAGHMEHCDSVPKYAVDAKRNVVEFQGSNKDIYCTALQT